MVYGINYIAFFTFCLLKKVNKTNKKVFWNKEQVVSHFAVCYFPQRMRAIIILLQVSF